MALSPELLMVEHGADDTHSERIVFFNDAVFAIAITLLALEVRAPEVDAAAIPHTLWALLPEIGVYALSFVIIGLYWINHHMFRSIVRYDYALIWLNISLLLCIAFLPVASGIVAHYDLLFAILLYLAFSRLHTLRSDLSAARAALAEAIHLFERLDLRRELAEARAELARLDDLDEAPAA